MFGKERWLAIILVILCLPAIVIPYCMGLIETLSGLVEKIVAGLVVAMLGGAVALWYHSSTKQKQLEQINQLEQIAKLEAIEKQKLDEKAQRSQLKDTAIRQHHKDIVDSVFRRWVDVELPRGFQIFRDYQA